MISIDAHFLYHLTLIEPGLASRRPKKKLGPSVHFFWPSGPWPNTQNFFRLVGMLKRSFAIWLVLSIVLESAPAAESFSSPNLLHQSVEIDAAAFDRQALAIAIEIGALHPLLASIVRTLSRRRFLVLAGCGAAGACGGSPTSNTSIPPTPP